jgi:hypothetical protein
VKKHRCRISLSAQSELCERFFQELQSKRIYRVGGGYIISAWVILQVAAIVFPSLELPSWSMKVVLDVVLLGFVPALLLGWHLDLRRARAEKSSVLNEDAAGGPQSPSEHTLLGQGGAGLDAKRPAMQIARRGETPESIQIAHYRERCFWSRGGYRFSGSCLGKQGCQRRYNRCMGRCREIHPP